MTSDKQNTGHIAKPFTPTLSAAFHRSSKTPLTPKLATPAGGYRTPRRLAQSEHPSSITTTPSSKDDHHSPASFLSANVTPRSNSRTTRRDTSIASPTSSTPSNTPNAPQPPCAQPVVAASGSQNGGGYRTERSPVRAGVKLEPPRPSRARTVTTEGQQSSRLVASPDAPGSPRFFHASDARSTSSPDPDPKVKAPVKQPTPATFFYANGKEERPSPGEEPIPTLPVVKRRSTGLSRSVVGGKPPTTSASPRVRSFKSNDFSPRLSDSVPSLPGPPLDGAENKPQRENLSLGNIPDRPPPVPVVRHMKSSSLDSANSSNLPREGLRPSPIIISPSDPQVDASAAASEPIPGLRPRVFSDGSTGSGETNPSSPVKSDVTAQANDPAASARIERKIMDLEISNSSLLAINRTLEREMRKQNAELRRYRRLSRTGRISMAPASRSVSGTALSATTEVEEGVSEMSSVRSPDELSDFSDEDEDSADEGVMSPGSLAEHDAKHRVRDEKRVFVDLAKHQEQLVDSQKMNQSIRRCLGWTEELIKEGQGALEYNVHVNDIELGGRVLAPEELQDIGESARGLLSSTSEFKPDEVSIEPEPEPESELDSAAETA